MARVQSRLCGTFAQPPNQIAGTRAGSRRSWTRSIRMRSLEIITQRCGSSSQSQPSSLRCSSVILAAIAVSRQRSAFALNSAERIPLYYSPDPGIAPTPIPSTGITHARTMSMEEHKPSIGSEDEGKCLCQDSEDRRRSPAHPGGRHRFSSAIVSCGRDRVPFARGRPCACVPVELDPH